MSEFGELRFESSRAFADDEEDEISESQFGLSVEWTEEGEKCLAEGFQPDIFCGFEGKVALGFGEGFLNDRKTFSLLGQVFTTGNEATVDLCSLRPRRKAAARIYAIGDKSKGEKSVVFVLVDFYGVPRFLANELVEKMHPLFDKSSEVIIFHSEIYAYHHCQKSCIGKLFHLTSSAAAKNSIYFGSILAKGERLPPPNLISGPSAAFLTQCEKQKKPGMLLVTYTETELVDSISLGPFLKAVSPSNANSGVESVFSQFKHTFRQPNVSNLYA